MNRKVRGSLISFVLMLLTSMSLISPAYAATGDAKLTFYDQTSGVIKSTCTTSISPCSITLTAGHQYSITLQEASNLDFQNGLVDVPSGALPGWSSRTHAESWLSPQCDSSSITYTNNGNTQWRLAGIARLGGVVQSTNCILYLSLGGFASSIADGSVTGRIARVGTSFKFATINYTTP